METEHPKNKVFQNVRDFCLLKEGSSVWVGYGFRKDLTDLLLTTSSDNPVKFSITKGKKGSSFGRFAKKTPPLDPIDISNFGSGYAAVTLEASDIENKFNLGSERGITDTVAGQDILDFFNQHIDYTHFFSAITGVESDSLALTAGADRPLDEFLKETFDMDVETKIPYSYVDATRFRSFLPLLLEGGEKVANRDGASISFVNGVSPIVVLEENKSAIDELKQELEGKTLDVCGEKYSYMDVLKIVAIVERQRLMHSTYLSTLRGALDPNLENKTNVYTSMIELLDEGPDFYDIVPLKDPDADRTEFMEIVQEYVDHRQTMGARYRSGKKLSKRAAEKEDRKMSQLVRQVINICLVEYQQSQPVFEFGTDFGIYTIDETISGDKKSQRASLLLERLNRMQKAGEIRIDDQGPFPEAVDALEKRGIKLHTENGTLEEKTKVLNNFDNQYLRILHDVCGNADLRIDKEWIDALPGKLIGEKEAAKKVFCVKEVPGVTDEHRSLADFVRKASRKYAQKDVDILEPFHGESKDGKFNGYVASDWGIDLDGDVTITSQLVKSGVYSPIKLGLLLKEVAEQETTDYDDFYSLGEVAEQLGCSKISARTLLHESDVQEKNKVLMDALSLVNEDPLTEGFEEYQSVFDFYRTHFASDPDVRPAVDSSVVYSKKDVELFKKQAFVTPEEAGNALGGNFAFDSDIFSDAIKDLCKSKKISLKKYTIDGKSFYYRPEIGVVTARINTDKDFYKAILYNQLNNEFSKDD